MIDLKGARRVLWITVAFNLLSTAAKLGAGYATGSLSLIASGFDSVFDSAANLIGLVGIYAAARPPDQEHPYGHRKTETLTAMSISVLLFLTTWELLQSAVERLRNPDLISAQVNAWSFAAMLLSMLINFVVAQYELREGHRLGSDVLIADALHTRADIWGSLAVIGGLIAVRLGFKLADPLISIAVALLIAKIGIDIIRHESPTLLDRAIVPIEQVAKIVRAVPGVVICHRVRSRGHASAIYIDLHIQVDPDMRTEQAHAIAHEVQYRLHRDIPGIEDVTIHVEPAGSQIENDLQDQVAAQIRQLAEEHDVNVHDIWVYEMNQAYFADMHILVDNQFSLNEAHEHVSAFEAHIQQTLSHLAELTIHIEPDEKAEPQPLPTKDELIRQVHQVAQTALVPGACHRVQARRGDTGWSLTMHCTLPGSLGITKAHQLSTQVEATLRRYIPGLERVVIHTEPNTTRE